METKLGKIERVSFGHGGYQECQVGISFTLGGDGWGVGDFWGYWGAPIKHTEHCKWTESERINCLGEIVMRISNLLKEAKVENVEDLKNIPVEVTFDRLQLKSWRVLNEVI